MPTQPLPPAPPDWNKTLQDLFEDMRLGQRSSIGWPESEWAINFERSQLPSGTRFPKIGDVFTARHPYPTSLLISWHAPVTTDVPYTLPSGCKIQVDFDHGDRPIRVTAVPINYKEIEKQALSRWIRWRPAYGGYYLSVNTLDLNTCFDLDQQ